MKFTSSFLSTRFWRETQLVTVDCLVRPSERYIPKFQPNIASVFHVRERDNAGRAGQMIRKASLFSCVLDERISSTARRQVLPPEKLLVSTTSVSVISFAPRWPRCRTKSALHAAGILGTPLFVYTAHRRVVVFPLAPPVPSRLDGISLGCFSNGLLSNFINPPITYYWTVHLILEHSYLVGNLTNSKIAEQKL